jgi:cell division protein FtsB
VTRTQRIFRLTGRLAGCVLALGVLAVVAIQFESIIARNIAIAGQVRASSDSIATLTAREEQQRRTIERLQNPAGAIPEIHDELRLVGANEEIIFVHGASDRSQEPHDWDESP